MNMEERFRLYQSTEQINIGTDAVEHAVKSAKSAFYEGEQEKILSYHEFLWIQMRFIQKRWWVLQLALLIGSFILLKISGGTAVVQKGMGVTSSLFIILMIPEIWKNRSCNSIEIEGTSLYSLKQVYAARMTLFAAVDVFLLSVFCGISALTVQIVLQEFMVCFLLPMSITACICFHVLCSRMHFNEVTAIAFCLLWNALWTFVILNENIYNAISPEVWFVLLGASVSYLCLAVFQVFCNCNRDWEENKIWN